MLHIVRVFVVEHCHFTGDSRTAIAQARSGAAGVEETGTTNIGVIFTQRGLGISYAIAGEWHEALAPLERALEISREAGTFLQTEPTTLVWIARVLVALGETDRARQTLDAVVSEVKKMGTTALSVVGHADTVGSGGYNQGLSERRARRVGNGLVERGIPAGNMTLAGRGERELAVATGDNVREPKNRRVEISLSK